MNILFLLLFFFQGVNRHPIQLPHTIPSCPEGKHMNPDCLDAAEQHYQAKKTAAVNACDVKLHDALNAYNNALTDCQIDFEHCAGNPDVCNAELVGCKLGALHTYTYLYWLAVDAQTNAMNAAEDVFDDEAVECCEDN